MSELLCARCLAELRPGSGDFYRIHIEAVADPTPPNDDEDLPPEELRRRIEDLVEQLGDVSEREAMDQVCRRLTLHLCGPCYRRWIEDPVGAG
jgi:hypothetical protein